MNDIQVFCEETTHTSDQSRINLYVPFHVVEQQQMGKYKLEYRGLYKTVCTFLNCPCFSNKLLCIRGLNISTQSHFLFCLLTCFRINLQFQGMEFTVIVSLVFLNWKTTQNPKVTVESIRQVSRERKVGLQWQQRIRN